MRTHNNMNQIDHPNRLLSTKRNVYNNDDSSKSLEKTYTSSNSSSFTEKQLMSRLKETEDLNASLELLVEQRTGKLIEIVSTNGKFLSIIAHDLRSPFSSIIGILELLKMSLKELNKDEIENYVDIVYKSA